MSLSKATITNTITGEEIAVMFNPEQYSISKGNNYAEIGIPGLDSPIIQFTRGNAVSLTMDLFFDTYETQADVRSYTDKILKLMKIDPGTKAPPVSIFSWGSLVFNFVLMDITKKFTMFLPSGIPVRAILSLTMKEYPKAGGSLLESSINQNGSTRTHTTTQGETLSGIAAEEYNDSTQWRDVAESNDIDNPRRLEEGETLQLP